MLHSWPCAFAPVALCILAVGTGAQEIPSKQQPRNLQHGPALLAAGSGVAPDPKVVLLRTSGTVPSTRKESRSGSGGPLGSSSEDQVSAIISSRGIRYVSPHRSDHHKHTSALLETVRERQFREPAKATIPNISQVAGNNATAGTDTKSQPNMLYFGVGVGTFLTALMLMMLSMRKLAYVQEDEGMLAEGNPQAEDEPAREASRNPTHPGDQLPHRMQQVLVSWIFIVASGSYFLDFVALQAGLEDLRSVFQLGSLLLWFMGFLIHIHWQLSAGSSRAQLICSGIKALACVVGQVHPIAMLTGWKEDDPEVWWAAVTAIAIWHLGNIFACVDLYVTPPPGSNRHTGLLAHGNVPVTEMWIDQFATWFLLIGAAALTHWFGQPEKQLLATSNWAVVFSQFGGAALWAFASCLKCEWCNGFQNCSHRPE